MGRGDEIRQSDLKGQNVNEMYVDYIRGQKQHAYLHSLPRMSPQASHELAGVAFGLTLDHSRSRECGMPVGLCAPVRSAVGLAG